MGQNPDGSPLILFDGFAQIPQVDLTPQTQRVMFTAVGVAVRCYDDVIHTRVQRDADTPNLTDGSADVEIHAPCRFNPADNSIGTQGGILANSTPDEFYTFDEETGNYPVFIDPLLIEREESAGEDYVAPWYISDAILYLLAQPNPGDDYVLWPNSTTIMQFLDTLAPPAGSDILNPATAVSTNCVIRDYDATGKALPEVLADLLGYAGFLMTWQVDADASGTPQTFLKIYRRDAAATLTPKLVYLRQPGRELWTRRPTTSRIFTWARREPDCQRAGASRRSSDRSRSVSCSHRSSSRRPGTRNRQIGKQFFASSFTPSTSAATRRKYR